jgi:putative flippase GtrA
MTGIAAQFIRFAGVGVIGTGAHYLVLVALMELFDGEAIIASSAGALTGALVNYILNYHFTFRSNKRHVEAMTKFLAIAAVGFVLNGLLMSLLVYGLGLFYLAAQVLTTLTVLIWNFAGNRWWTFAT